MEKIYAQYGCGLSAPIEWINFDVSPTLRVQKIPIIGSILKNQLNTVFPNNVKYGNIISGLPLNEDSCQGVYCSHTLEHLALNDLRLALRNTFKILKPKGVFRCVLPDLEFVTRKYLKDLENGDSSASLKFMGSDTLLGVTKRPEGVKGIIVFFLGNSNHLWMWDFNSLSEELKSVGFKYVRRCEFNDCSDEKFKLVEDESRFENSLAIECSK